MKKLLLHIAMFWMAGTLLAHAAVFTSEGNGMVYSFDKLSQISGSGVTREGDVYVLQGTCTISRGDQFVIDSGATIAFGEYSELILQGASDLRASEPTMITNYDHAESCYGINVQGDDGKAVEVSNLTFEYVGLRGSMPTGMNVRSCHFLRHNGTASGALYLGCNGATFHVADCSFEDCRKAAIGGAANYFCPLTVENCTFKHNSTTNGNVPQLNLTVASDITIRNCTVEGDPTLNMVGGIAVSNFMGYEGMNVRIEGCTVSDNRYGITTLGIMNITIANNQLIGNCHEVNANNGGSGISLYDPYMKQKAIVTGNHIEGNLWGITVIGCGDVNIGKTEVPADAPDYNPGLNVFADNGNNGVRYDLYNNSANTVFAQGNLWGVEKQDREHIEEVVFHKNDDDKLGEVIFMPAGNPDGISHTTMADTHDNNIYRMDGTVMPQTSALPHGLYIINGKKVLR